MSTKNKPRLLVLTSTFPRWVGDTEPPFVFELSRRLTDSFDITVLAPRSPGSREREIMDGLHTIRFPYFIRKMESLAGHNGGILNRLRASPLSYLLVPFFLMGQFLALLALLRSAHWDLIHAHWLVPQGLVALLARKACRYSVPLVCTSHGGDLFALRGSALRALKRSVMRASVRVTVVSDAMRDEVLSMEIAPEKIAVIPMGVDLRQRFTPDTEKAPRRTRELLFVGRLVEKKGVELLLKAPSGNRANPPGHTPENCRRRPARITVTSIGRNARHHGSGRFSRDDPAKDLPALYHRATMLVAPFQVAGSGDQEGFPLVPLEAIGCGCPLVCGQIVAFGDIIRHDREAILVPPNDHRALAVAIVALLDDPQRRERLALQARARCQEAFDWNAIAARYRELLLESIPGASRSATTTKPSPQSRP